MTRKRFIRLLMSTGMQRNEAVRRAYFYSTIRKLSYEEASRLPENQVLISFRINGVGQYKHAIRNLIYAVNRLVEAFSLEDVTYPGLKL